MDRYAKRYGPMADSLLPIRTYLDMPEGSNKTEDILDDLKEEMIACHRCTELYKNGKVFESGPRTAKLFLYGEAPAKTEINTNILFSGPAGDMLNRILKAPKVEIERRNVYLANALKCKLPGRGNKSKIREAHITELVNCSRFAHGQILAVDPIMIVVMGAPAVKSLFGPRLGTKPMTEIHGKVIDFKVFNRTYPAVLTYHPASILNRGDMDQHKLTNRRRIIWKDWQKISKMYRELINGNNTES